MGINLNETLYLLQGLGITTVNIDNLIILFTENEKKPVDDNKEDLLPPEPPKEDLLPPEPPINGFDSYEQAKKQSKKGETTIKENGKYINI